MERDQSSVAVSHPFEKADSTQLGFDSTTSSDHPLPLFYPSVDSFIQDYQSLNYACCGSHIGFQNRKDPSIVICSSFYRSMLNLGHQLETNTKAKCEVSGEQVKPTAAVTQIMPSDRHCETVTRSGILPGHCDPGSGELRSAEPADLRMQNEVSKGCGRGAVWIGKMEGISRSQASSLEGVLNQEERPNHEANANSKPTSEINLTEAVAKGKGAGDGNSVVTESGKGNKALKTHHGEHTVRHVGLAGAQSADKVNNIWKVADLDPSLSFGNMVECVISFTWNPSSFTLNTVTDLTKAEKLQDDVAHYCVEASPLSRVPAVGDILFAPYKGEFYRGAVVKVYQAKGRVKVFFIDFGDRATLKIAECREPCEKIMKSNPRYGIDFTLNLNVPLPPSFQLNDEIQALVDESVLYMHMDSEPDSNVEWRGTLFFDKEKSMSLNSVIQKHIVASSADASADQSPNSTILTPVQDKVNSEVKLKPITSAVSGEKEKENICTRKICTASKFSPNLFKISETTMKVNCAWKDDLVSISSTEDETNLNDLTEAISKHSKTAPQMLRKPNVHEVVLAPYDDGDGYYRARITALNDTNVGVTFVDYGDDAVVSYTDLKELNAEIVKHPIYGVTFKTTESHDAEHVVINIAEIRKALESSTEWTIEQESSLPPRVPEAKLSHFRKTIHDSKLTQNLTDGAIVRINFVWNDALVSISALKDHSAMENLAELISTYAESAPRMSTKPDVDEIVIAPYRETSNYFRARVKAVHGDRVQVLFVDFGDESYAHYTDLLELNVEIAQRPIYGAMFRMAGVPHTDQVTTDNAELCKALELAARIELLEKNETGIDGELNGVLWVGQDRSWNDIVLEFTSPSPS